MWYTAVYLLLQVTKHKHESLQTHSKRSLHPSSRSASNKSATKQRQLQTIDSGLIGSDINVQDLSHLSFTRPAPKSSPAIHELLSMVSVCNHIACDDTEHSRIPSVVTTPYLQTSKAHLRRTFHILLILHLLAFSE